MGPVLRVHPPLPAGGVRCRVARPPCWGCGALLWSKGERRVVLVDLPALGRPVRLVWHKRRWRCGQQGCGTASFTAQEAQIAPARALLTARAARWATRRAGRGEAIQDTASVLGCDWHTVNASVRRWGQALLAADTQRVSTVEALGLDETLFCRRGRFAKRAWSTSIVDVGSGQLLDIVPGRTAKRPGTLAAGTATATAGADPLGDA